MSRRRNNYVYIIFIQTLKQYGVLARERRERERDCILVSDLCRWGDGGRGSGRSSSGGLYRVGKISFRI